MSGKPVLSGDLRFISLADCFQILGGNNSTGTLHLKSPFVSTSGSIFFSEGNPINATNGSKHGLEAIYPLFGWAEGTFEFKEEISLPKRVINSGRMEIVLDALRMLDDGLIERVGPTLTSNVFGISGSGHHRGGKDTLPVIKGPLTDYMFVIDEEEFRSGVKIVTEGGHGTWIWVILEGMVAMTRDTHKGTMNIAKLGEGSFIGTLTSFFQRDHIRSATLSAIGDIQLGVLDTQRLYKEFLSLSSEFRALIISLDGRLKKITDKAVALYEDDEEINLLDYNAEAIQLQEIEEKNVFEIKKGQAHVVRKTQEGALPIMSLEQGDIFGGMPFLDMGHEPRCASIIGSEGLELSKLDSGILQHEYNQLSQTLRDLINNTCMCVSVTTRLAFDLQDCRNDNQ